MTRFNWPLTTLAYLSPILKEDLHFLLAKCRLDNYVAYKEIHNRIEGKIDNGAHDLDDGITELEFLLESTKNTYYKNVIQQFLFLASAIVLYRKEGRPWEALDRLIQAIKITTPDFSLDNYQACVYSSMEIRLMMGMGLILYGINQREKYFEIMTFCMSRVDPEDQVFPKVCYNLSGAYLRRRCYHEGLRYSELGIDWCKQNRVLNGISLMYYCKGVCEFHLGRQEYEQSIRASLNLCDSMGQSGLRAKIIRYCTEIYKMKDQRDKASSRVGRAYSPTFTVKRKVIKTVGLLKKHLRT